MPSALATHAYGEPLQRACCRSRRTVIRNLEPSAQDSHSCGTSASGTGSDGRSVVPITWSRHGLEHPGGVRQGRPQTAARRQRHRPVRSIRCAGCSAMAAAVRGRRLASAAGPAWLALWLAFNCFVLITEQQRGVVLRFGQFVAGPAARSALQVPWPVERVDQGQRHPDQGLQRHRAGADPRREHRQRRGQRAVPRRRSAAVPVRHPRRRPGTGAGRAERGARSRSAAPTSTPCCTRAAALIGSVNAAPAGVARRIPAPA